MYIIYTLRDAHAVAIPGDRIHRIPLGPHMTQLRAGTVLPEDIISSVTQGRFCATVEGHSTELQPEPCALWLASVNRLQSSWVKKKLKEFSFSFFSTNSTKFNMPIPYMCAECLLIIMLTPVSMLCYCFIRYVYTSFRVI